MNQLGKSGSPPPPDPVGPGKVNGESEEILDVEWAHAIAPMAKIVAIECNSDDLLDITAGALKAATLPGVSVVSISYGYNEGSAAGQASASFEANYDSQLAGLQGVTFLAASGDYGTADASYPAFSPYVVAVGGTTLTLSPDNSYGSETGWGYSDQNHKGVFIGSGGGVSIYENQPTYQANFINGTKRSIPDVSFDADPATGAAVLDTYNQPIGNPWEIGNGTSLATPCWAGLIALVNQGRAAPLRP